MLNFKCRMTFAAGTCLGNHAHASCTLLMRAMLHRLLGTTSFL